MGVYTVPSFDKRVIAYALKNYATREIHLYTPFEVGEKFNEY